MTLAHLTAAAGLAWALAVVPAAAQSPLSAALDLYAAASYDDALAALDGARHAQPSTDDLVTIYRTHPVFTGLRDSSQIKGRCGLCEYVDICGGSRARAFAWTGDPLEADPLCPFIPPVETGARH